MMIVFLVMTTIVVQFSTPKEGDADKDGDTLIIAFMDVRAEADLNKWKKI